MKFTSSGIYTKDSEGKYIDKKCPFTGNVSIRGAVLKAVKVNV